MGPSKAQSKCSPARVRNCLRTFLAHLFSHIGLCVLIVGYAIVGAALFERLESGYEMEQRDNKVKNWTDTFTKIREMYVHELWNITEQFNVLYEKDWNAAVERELKKFEVVVASAAKRDGYDLGGGREVEQQWSFSGALLYSVSIITTIGYGNTAPRTPSGKILTMFYAVIGVPLMLLWLSNIGTLMANTFKFAYSHSCCPSSSSGSSDRSGKAVQKRTGSSKFEPSSTQVKYSVSAKKCETRVIQEHPQQQQLQRLATTTRRQQRGSLKNLDAAAKQVLLECAEYNVSVSQGQDERSRRVIQQLHSAESAIDELSSDEDSVIDISSAGLAAASREGIISYECGGNNGRAGAGAGAGTSVCQRGGSKGVEGTPSRVPLLQESGPDLVDIEAPDDSLSGGGSPTRGALEGLDSERHQPVPISLVLIFVVVYILVGATVFSMWEDWNFLESAYFCFITLSTIGLGDYVPGRSLKSDGSKEGHAQLIVCCLYLVLGLAIIAMSFNLVQEEVAAKVKRLAKRIGIIKDNSDG